MTGPKPISGLHLSFAQMVVRFGLLAVLLLTFAGLGSKGFEKVLTALLLLAAMFCATIAAARREPLLAPMLTHWDEAAVYAVIAGSMLFLMQPHG